MLYSLFFIFFTISFLFLNLRPISRRCRCQCTGPAKKTNLLLTAMKRISSYKQISLCYIACYQVLLDPAWAALADKSYNCYRESSTQEHDICRIYCPYRNEATKVRILTNYMSLLEQVGRNSNITTSLKHNIHKTPASVGRLDKIIQKRFYTKITIRSHHNLRLILAKYCKSFNVIASACTDYSHFISQLF